MAKKPTIKDVASHAGVSFKTVSRVINGQAGVSEENRQRVLQAVADLNYVVNHSARSLAAGVSRTLGVVIPRIHDPHVFDLVYYIGELAEQQGIQVLILTWPTLSENLHLMYVGHGIVGALILVTPRSVEIILPLVKAMKIPAIVLEKPLIDDTGRDIPSAVPYVASQNREGAREGVRYLLELGHRRIAYIGGTESTQSRLRFLGYCDALVSQGLPVRAEYVCAGNWTWDSGYQRALSLWALPERPTAIFCANDNMALGALCALRGQGALVPEDVSLLGFDDIPAAMHSLPPLSTVRQPTRQMVQTAFDLLLRAMRGAEEGISSQLLPTELVLRGSCVPPRDR